MARLKHTISLILKLWLLKYWAYLILYVVCVLSAYLSIRYVDEPIIPVLLLAYANWILFVLSGADKKLGTTKYYKVLNIPPDFVMFAKAMLLSVFAIPQIYLLSVAYELDFRVLIFILFVITHSMFHVERSKLPWAVRLLLEIFGVFVIIPVLLGLLVVVTNSSLGVLMGVVVLILIAEGIAVAYGKYHSI